MVAPTIVATDMMRVQTLAVRLEATPVSASDFPSPETQQRDIEGPNSLDVRLKKNARFAPDIHF